VLAEIHRVLRRGGIMTLIEPDWKAIALYPGSPCGGDDDHTLSALLRYYQRKLPHALIGRQLPMLLRRQGEHVWAEANVRALAFTLSSWRLVDAVLQLSNTARALAADEPGRADEIEAWIETLSRADASKEFSATVPLFFAFARKTD